MKILLRGLKVSVGLLVVMLMFAPMKKYKWFGSKSVAEDIRMEPVIVRARPRYSKDLRAFLNKMARIESDNNQFVTNRYGMMGKYQFHPRTLREIGIKTNRKTFLHNAHLQDSAMVLYMKQNAKELRPIIRQFSGKTVRGVKVTKSGILASAHLTGTMGVLTFFYPHKYRHKTKDANGTSVTMYMNKFANYNIGY